MKLSNKVYNAGKQVAQIWLPSLGTLYVALGLIWGQHAFPAADNVSKTVIAVDAFLGVVLGISSLTYRADGSNFAGSIILEDHPSGEGSQLRVGDLDPNAVLSQKQVTFKVLDRTSPPDPLPVQNTTDPRLLK